MSRCSPVSASAHQLGPWLEATLWHLVSGPAPPTQPQHRQAHCAGAPHRPAAPRLSLLLAAQEDDLENLSQQLLPDPALPWEVVSRPLDVGLHAAWSSALEAAQGELAWPLTPPLPPQALMPMLLESFERPGVDFVQLAWRLGGCTLPSDDPLHQELGCLAGQTSWWKRLLPLSASEPDATLLLDLRRRAAHRGAGLYSLPLAARTR